VGTTGESATLDYEEQSASLRSRLIRRRQIKVMAGTGGNSTKEAIYLTQEAEKAGADASLQVAPTTQADAGRLFQHFHAIARSTKLPIILYSIRALRIEIAVDTVDRLAHDCVNVVGIKEAGATQIGFHNSASRSDINSTILSGDDSLTLRSWRWGRTAW